MVTVSAIVKLCVTVCLCLPRHAGGVGIKRRLAESTAAESIEAVGASSSSGGVRISAGSASSSSAGVPSSAGIRQRLSNNQDDTAAASSSAGKPYTEYLKEQWGKGKLSAKQVQTHAFKASQQGAVDLEPLASAGTHGKHPQNVQRTLLSVFGEPAGAAPIDWVELPTKFGRKSAHPFLFPHKFFQAYFKDRRSMFERHIAGPKGATRQFWESIASNQFVKQHPGLPENRWTWSVPLGMHGDGGAFSDNDNLYAYSWNSLMGSGQTSAKRFLFTVIKKSDMVADTQDRIFKLFGWSMNVLLSGRTPITDWAGRPMSGGGQLLAGGFCGVLCQIRGDWAFYKEALGFPQWNENVRMCWLCKASSVINALVWTDCSEDAGWRETTWTHEEYLEHLRGSGLAIPVLFAEVTGLRLECVMIDVLHTVDLGIAAHIVANIMWLIAFKKKKLGGRNHEENLVKLDEDLDQWYKDNKESTRLRGKLTMDKIRSKNDWPKLKGKGAAIRHVVPYALHLMLLHGDGSTNDLLATAICQLLVKFYEFLSSESMFLSDAVRIDMPKLGQRLGTYYQRLSASALLSAERMWKMTPKLHLFIHLTSWQVIYHGNPRYYWTYADEDLVGLMIEIAESCHPRTVAVITLFKWLHVVFANEGSD